MAHSASNSRSPLLLALPFAVAACTTPATTVRVTLGTDAPSRVTAMRAVASLGASIGMSPGNHDWVRDGSSTEFRYPSSFAVTPGAHPTDSRVTLRVEFTFAPATATQPAITVRRTARFAFTPHVTGFLPLFIATSCAAEVSPPAHCSTSIGPCTVSRYREEQIPAQTCGDNGTCTGIDVTPAPADQDGSFDVVQSADITDATAPDVTDVLPDVPMDAARPYHLYTTTGASLWTEVTPGGAAPTEPVIAAFAAQSSGEIMAMTATDLLRFSVGSSTWVDRRAWATVFPELVGHMFWEAEVDSVTTPAHLVFYGAEGLWEYQWTQSTYSATYVRFTAATSLPPAIWGTSLAPSFYQVEGVYFNPDNHESWVTVDPSSVCGGRPTTVGPYTAFATFNGVGPGVPQLSIFDGNCSQFVDRGDVVSRLPFSLAGAPAVGNIEALTYLNGLWAFTQ